MKDDESGILAGKRNFHAVDLCYKNVSSANTGTQERYLAAICICQSDPCCIWMGTVNVTCGNMDLKPCCFCKFRCLTDAYVIGSHSHDPGNKSFICTMSLICFCKGSMKENVRLYSRGSKKSPCNTADPCGTCCVRAGRTDHNRTKYIKYIHRYTFFTMVFVKTISKSIH